MTKPQTQPKASARTEAEEIRYSRVGCKGGIMAEGAHMEENRASKASATAQAAQINRMRRSIGKRATMDLVGDNVTEDAATKEAAHTPGPWHCQGRLVYSSHGNICEIGEPNASTLVSHTPLEIGSKDRHEAYANAKLIASAPETAAERDRLRKAAQRVEAHSHWSNDVYGYVVSKEAMDMLCRSLKLSG